jgi:hypothetical protein
MRVPLVIAFVPNTTLYREPDRPSDFPIIRNGPPGTFVVFPNHFRVSLPTDQIVEADEATGAVRAGFGGMSFVGENNGRLIFRRVRDLLPEDQLSPDRSWTMTLDPAWVTTVEVDGRIVWPVNL